MVDLVNVLLAVDSRQVKAGRHELDKLGNAGDKTAASTNKVTSSIKMMGAAIAGAATAALALTFREAIKSASALEEATGKFNVVFAGQRREAEAMTKALVDGYAMSTREAKEFLSGTQDLLVPMGIAADKAIKMSDGVVKLAADLGSFNNLPTADVMANIQSALTGEYQSMKKFGVILNETRIKQEAFNLGLYDGKGLLDANAKAQAALSLINKDSAAAQGDQIRTMGSYANQSKKATARLEDLMAVMGNELLPVAAKFKNMLGDIAEYLIKSKASIFEYAKNIRSIAEAIGLVVGARLITHLIAVAAQTAINIQQAIAYQVVLSRMAGASLVASSAMGVLRGAMALLGGPVGAILTAAGALYLWITNSKSATESTKDLKDEVNSLLGKMGEVKNARIDEAMEKTVAQMEELGDRIKQIKANAENQGGPLAYGDIAQIEEAGAKIKELAAMYQELNLAKNMSETKEAVNNNELENEKTEALAVLYDERDAADLERLTNKYTNDQNLLMNNLQAEQELLTAAHQAKKLTDDQYARLSFASDIAYSEKSVLLKKQEEERKRMLGEQGARNALAITDALSVLMSSKNKEMFEIGKAAAIGSALINTYLAITKTMSATPYPWNIGLAVAQGLAGLTQVNNIRSQSFGSSGSGSMSVTGGGGAGAGFSGGGAIPGAQPIPSFTSKENIGMSASALPPGAAATPDAKEKNIVFEFHADSRRTFFSRDEVEGLFTQANDLASDGSVSIREFKFA